MTVRMRQLLRHGPSKTYGYAPLRAREIEVYHVPSLGDDAETFSFRLHQRNAYHTVFDLIRKRRLKPFKLLANIAVFEQK